jgi:hypothetical protein
MRLINRFTASSGVNGPIDRLRPRLRRGSGASILLHPRAKHEL